MKLGIVGTGMIVQELMQIMPAITLERLALFGRDQAKTQALARQHGIKQYFFDYQAMLASDLDTIYIALPNHLHFEFARRALAADKHVILEKPITSNYAQFQQLRELATVRRKILLEAVTVHYLPAYQEIKQKIGALGELKIVSLNYSQYSSRYDRFQAGEILPAFDPQKSGGALMDLNVYNLHFAVGLFGAPQSCIYAANIERGIDTSGILLLDYGAFKAVCIGAKDCSAPVLLSIQGNKGNISVPMPANAMNQFSLRDNQGETTEYHFEAQHRMLYEFQQFVRIIDRQDNAFAEHMLDISATVCRLLEQARKQQGILFAGEQ
ncbi:Gfo/Idh/MocA family protein [Necropsobacter massiliensis]|uniref:Gfo/Idh/MocA family protein n=1 Tax=Necropsobacter massiliensis TaxID=1400001 RepID=UPI0005960DDD|nr:Gfo/Idh/MocA family oxidoreductase [Necropsobacter massiliensis]